MLRESELQALRGAANSGLVSYLNASCAGGSMVMVRSVSFCQDFLQNPGKKIFRLHAHHLTCVLGVNKGRNVWNAHSIRAWQLRCLLCWA
jgi:hypothetical protein